MSGHTGCPDPAFHAARDHGDVDKDTRCVWCEVEYWPCLDGRELPVAELSDHELARAAFMIGAKLVPPGPLLPRLELAVATEMERRDIRPPAYLKTKCDLCGGRALYRHGQMAYCKAHRAEAVGAAKRDTRERDKNAGDREREQVYWDNQALQKAALRRNAVGHKRSGRGRRG